jgi:hypothetical protein
MSEPHEIALATLGTQKVVIVNLQTPTEFLNAGPHLQFGGGNGGDGTTNIPQNIWTPAPGKTFVLLGGIIFVGNNLTGAAPTLVLLDGSTPIGIKIPLLLGVAAYNVPFNLPGPGYISIAINNSLAWEFTNAGATPSTNFVWGGIVNMIFWGIEQ